MVRNLLTMMKEEVDEGGEVIVVVHVGRGVLEGHAVLLMIQMMIIAMVITIMGADIRGVVKEMRKNVHQMVMHLLEVHHRGLLVLYQIYSIKGLI
jgi:hypothetical protein